VITGHLAPDRATIARFICRHEQALADLCGDVLRLCDRARLVKPGVVSIDGTRWDGNCSPDASCQFEQIAREVAAPGRALRAGGGPKAEVSAQVSLEFGPARIVARVQDGRAGCGT
jgi:hypothetical protein